MSRSLVWGASRGTKLARKLQRDMSAWPKNAGKSGKWEEMKEKCWKIVGKGDKRREGRRERGEKKKNWRKKEKRERIGGQRWKWEDKRKRKVGKPREPKACYAWSGEGTEQRVATWKVHCAVWCSRIARSTANTKHLCVTFSYLAEVMKPDHQHWPHTVLTTVPNSSKIPRKTTKNDNLVSTNLQKCPKNKAKTTKSCTKSSKISQKRQNTTIWCPKLTNRGSYVSEIFEQARIKEFI